MRRSAAPKRNAPLPPRKKPVPPVNRKRKAKRYAEQYGERGARVRWMPCLCYPALEPCFGPIEAAHVKSRGAGGDRRSLVPLCRAHHSESHSYGIETFGRLYGLDLHAEAERIASQLDAEGLP